MIISKTPYRISFFGGGTDFPNWYKDNRSLVISTTINHYSYITLKDLPKIFKYKFRIRYFYREEASNINEIKHPVIKSILKYKKFKGNLDIVHHGDLPARSGIGSSSSFSVGMINVLNALNNIKITKKRLAKQSIHLEQNILKEKVGSQDQIAAVYGGLNSIYFHKKKFSCIPVKMKKKNLVEFQKWIQLFFIDQRSSQYVEKDKINQMKKNSIYYLKINEIAKKALKILKLQKKNFLLKLGKLLNDQWELKKKLSKKVSNKRIDYIYKKALSNGAVGGKIIGAGGGGFIMFLTPPSKQKKLQKVLNLSEVKIKFDSKGSTIIYKD